MLYDYTIRSMNGLSVRAFKPSNPALPSLGYGGHPIGARPKRKALTIYQGRQPFQLEVPMVLYRGGASIESDREALDNMATTEGDVYTQQPPVVKITASYALPIPPALGNEDTARWWIEDLKWGEEFRKAPHEGGFLTWKEVTVTLLEWSKSPIVNGGFRWGSYRVKKPPDTLKSIAAKHSMTVKQLQEANPKLRSDGSLKHGMVVKCIISVPFTVVKEGDF
jgi:LysM domain